MSFLITVKVPGDMATFSKALAERGDEFAAIAERARPVGALHHQFGLGDGFVLVVDEWESPEQFESFFTSPDLQAFIASVGGDTSAAPEITVTQAVDSADKF